MALSEKTEFDSITLLLDGQMSIRRARVILDDTTEISRTFHREVLVPGQDVSQYPARLKALCGFVWTPAVVAAWQAAHPAP